MKSYTYTLVVESSADPQVISNILGRATYGLTEDLWGETGTDPWKVALTGEGLDERYSFTEDDVEVKA